ncbi:MAG: hypothetical protein QOF33_2699, partial [Thermomicrobiales bacterium]|nr:hypothetical protein [Thermomicrobiales bacterium]
MPGAGDNGPIGRYLYIRYEDPAAAFRTDDARFPE